MQSGIALTAIVTDVRRSRIDINRQTRWYVCYRYAQAGRALSGESYSMHGEAVAEFKPGDRVTIKVDPRQPERNLFLGRA